MWDELDAKLEQYIKAFGEGFPMIPLGWNHTDEEVIEIIDECISKGKTVYDIGYLSAEGDIYY